MQVWLGFLSNSDVQRMVRWINVLLEIKIGSVTIMQHLFGIMVTTEMTKKAGLLYILSGIVFASLGGHADLNKGPT